MSSHQIVNAKRKAEALFQQGRFAEARAVHRKLCRHVPQDPDNWLDYGVVCGVLGEHAESEAAFRRALQLNPHLPQAYFNLGKLLGLLGRLHEAEPFFRAYVSIMPAVAEGHYQLARVLVGMGRFGEALPAFQEALQRAPGAVAVMLDYGAALQHLGRFDDAESVLNQALALAPAQGAVHLALANLFASRRRFDDAAEALRRAAEHDPTSRPAVLHQTGNIAKDRGRYQEAADHYERALALQPDGVDLRLEHAANLLRLGRFEEGWQEYEARTRHPRWLDEMGAYRFSRPRWDGGRLQGLTVLVYAEQGFGDTLQFGRYLPLLHARGATVIFYCQRELVRLFRRMEGIRRVEEAGEAILAEQFDVHVPLMSLPGLFGTRLETIPAAVPYLSADPADLARWRTRIGDAGVKVGLVWSGRPTHLENFRRSLAPRALAPLAAVRGARFFALQKGGDVAALRSAGLEVEDLSGELHDFADAAAAIAALDLIITVDTAMAHLAGASCRPVWTLLPFPSDWRWLAEGEESPWYPTMRLFRCGIDEAWPAVVQRAAVALEDVVRKQALGAAISDPPASAAAPVVDTPPRSPHHDE